MLVGLLVVWALQETLGWNFTGLVVPGYLASILVIHPLTGAVVAAEAMLTWAVVAITSDLVPRWWPWAPIFGRERFLLYLVASVGIRIVLEGGGFDLLTEGLGVLVDEDLHSMGLVVVPLAANALWRSGRGALYRLGVPVLITWGLLHFVLLRHTNLSLSSFELTYEDLALDFVSSPRAYILLLTGAAMGSWVNQRWGWDFGGIIVPGLLALCWLQPARIAATLVETGAIALALRGLLQVPWIKTANFTGGRPMVLAYCVGYTLKFALGWALGGRWPGFEVRDLFGFGYLLSSIIALRVLRHGDPLRAIVPALVTSFGAFVGGSAVGYALAVWLPAAGPPDVRPPPPARGDALHALLLGAWRNEGPAPTSIVRLTDSPTPALVTGGDGFGSLLVRGEGRDLVVTGRVGAPLEGPAALAVATALDARVVLLCGQEGRSCERARAQLATRLPVLLVTSGEATALRVVGPIDPAIDLALLGRLVGAFGTPSVADPAGSPVDTLVLADAARARAVAGTAGAEPAPFDDLRALPPPEIARTEPPDAGTLRLYETEVLRPWLAWRAGEAWGEDALRAAAGRARLLGLGLTRTGERSAVVGEGFQVRVDRAGHELLVQVPDAREEPGAYAVGRALVQALGGGALVVTTPDAWTHDGDERGSFGHTGLLGALQALGPAARVLTVRSVPGIYDPGADIVLSLGRALPAGAQAPAFVDALRTRLEGAGFAVALYDGSAARLPFHDPGNAARAAAAAATGEDAHLTVWITDAVERRLAPVDGDHPLHRALSVVGLAERRWDLRDLAPFALDGPPPPRWDRAAAALDLFVRTGRSSALLPIAPRAARVCDPMLGCRWIAVERCEKDACEGVLLPFDRTDAAAGAVDALAFGGRDVAYRRPVALP